MSSPDISIFCQDVYNIVSQIPKGKVLTYGKIANLMGWPRHSRLVGYALHHVPKEFRLPCHRVVNANGRIVPTWKEQRLLLEKEGVTFTSKGHVNLKMHLWDFEQYF